MQMLRLETEVIKAGGSRVRVWSHHVNVTTRQDERTNLRQRPGISFEAESEER